LEENEISVNLESIFYELLSDNVKRKALAENAFAVLRENRGACAKTIEKLQLLFNKSA
jgi:hypothetical protein